MTGPTEAAVIIPIVAFILLFAWVGLVFWADGHPRWGNSEPGQASLPPARLPEGSSIPRPRLEDQAAPRQPAPQDTAGRTNR